MKRTQEPASAAEGLWTRTFTGEYYDDCYAAFLPGSSRSIEKAYESLASWLYEEGVSLMFEKAYGDLSCREKIEEVRPEAFRKYGLECGAPSTFICGSPLGRPGFSGLQAWGVRSPSGGPVTVDCGRLGRGRLLEAGGARRLYLSSVTGALPDGALPAEPKEQARRMFLNARDALQTAGFDFRDVFRTWIYLRRILDWYPEFNEARNALYPTEGFFPKGSSVYPASTGIQGSRGGEECFMDVLAFAADEGAQAASPRPILTSSHQKEAFDYGSAFSRGMVLAAAGRKTIHVSGTAAIDETGATVHAGDPYEQSRATFRNVARVLEEQGAGLGDLVQATLFCRSEEAYRAALRAAAELGFSGLPVLAVRADVCRKDLEVELEAIAAV